MTLPPARDVSLTKSSANSWRHACQSLASSSRQYRAFSCLSNSISTSSETSTAGLSCVGWGRLTKLSRSHRLFQGGNRFQILDRGDGTLQPFQRDGLGLHTAQARRGQGRHEGVGDGLAVPRPQVFAIELGSAG